MEELKKALNEEMYELKFTTAYKKSYKLMKKRSLDLSLLDEVVNTLRQAFPVQKFPIPASWQHRDSSNQ